ncbi:MAG: hypothetical protein HC888_01815 [Candidatus Competibacteraceae bacterium]|nr:hypothetical protein [Candidatus Competibacteraceae bacterium]
MKIALAQLRVNPGDCKTNLARMLNLTEEAAKQEADLIAFPEMSVGGYLLGDRWTDDDFVDDLMACNDQIARTAKKHNIAVAFGNIFKTNQMLGQDGRAARFNAIYVYNNEGKPALRLGGHAAFGVKNVHFKTNLPNYRFFDDERYWLSALDYLRFAGVEQKAFYQPFVIRNKQGEDSLIGFALCEDLWCKDYQVHGGVVNPSKWLYENGADAVVNLSASPWTYGKHRARDNAVKFVYRCFWRQKTSGLVPEDECRPTQIG